MLDQLLETKSAPQRKPLGTVISLVLHAALAVAALRATHHDAVALPKPVEVMLKQVAPREVIEPAQPSRSSVQPASAPTYRGFQTLSAPVDIPIDVPAVDLTAAATDPGDFTGRDAPGGRGNGDPTVAPMSVGADVPFSGVDVDKAAATLPGSPAPAYPEMLKASGVEGEVQAQFVVDTLGRVEPGSFRVLTSSHDAFSTAVKGALPRMRFIPAEAGGRKVRMIVQQRFAFALDR